MKLLPISPAGGLGQSTCVSVRSVLSKNLNCIDILKIFREDDLTESMVMVGQIGGAVEELAVRYIGELTP